MLKRAPLPLPHHRGEAGDTGDADHDLGDNVDSLEERILQVGMPSKTPFRFMQSNQSPCKQSLAPEHWTR